MLEVTNIRNGAILNHTRGIETDQYLEIKVEGIADPQAAVKVNGIEAERADRLFSAPVRLTRKINEITVSADSSFGEQLLRLTVLWDKKSFKRYNYYIDDCSFFYTEIAKERPKSLFDHFFLKRLKEIHDRHGAKFTLNSFYRNDHNPFELKDFPDCYKSEWLANADWLRLSFHAYSEFPDRPYQRTSPEKLMQDFDLVKNEIIRFAGEKTFIVPVVLHWAMANPEVFAQLKQRGMRMINGDFIGGKTSVSEKNHAIRVCDIGYFYEKDVALYIEKYKNYYDKFTGMILNTGVGATANLYPAEILTEKLQAAMNSPYHNETIGMATHEQYTFPFYANYIPDHLDRIETCCRFMKEHGYAPVFFAEGLLGNKAWDEK